MLLQNIYSDTKADNLNAVNRDSLSLSYCKLSEIYSTLKNRDLNSYSINPVIRIRIKGRLKLNFYKILYIFNKIPDHIQYVYI